MWIKVDATESKISKKSDYSLSKTPGCHSENNFI